MVDNTFSVAITPGRRPWGFWKYEAGHWSEYGVSEEEAVYKHFADANERAAIERQWYRDLEKAVASSLPAPNPAPRHVATGLYAVPKWFYDRHAKEAIAQYRAGEFCKC